ncbi:MAG: hypothetical protein IKR57_02285 [Bacilli bacterium]|nr:hypothetical protein [Bacilli bacterium]
MFNNIANAKNPNSTDETLFNLSKSNNWRIRQAVASNPKCPSIVLESLSNDSNLDVRVAVASNTKCPPNALLELSKDIVLKVRESVVKNPNTPEEALKILLEDPNEEIKLLVLGHANCSHGFLLDSLKNADEKMQVAILNNPKTPEDIIDKMIKARNIIGYDRIQAAVNNPNCSKKILVWYSEPIDFNFSHRLESFQEHNILLAVAKNPNSSSQAFDNLIKNARSNNKCINDDILLAIIENPNCPPENLYDLSKFNNVKIRIAVSKSPKISLETFDKLSKDGSHLVRFHLISNPKCPENILERLSRDVNSQVKEKATQKLNNIRSQNKFKPISNNNKESSMIEGLLQSKQNESEQLNKELFDIQKRKEQLMAREQEIKALLEKNALEEEQLKKKLDDQLEKERIQAELELKKKIDEEKKRFYEEQEKILLNILTKAKQLYEEMLSSDMRKKFDIGNIERINVPESRLLDEYEDHKEINKKYVEYLPYINFQFVDTNNLKVSGGYDWSTTNISVNPQTVYKRSLNGSKFGNQNIRFKSLKGIDLRGTDISEDEDCYDIEYALIDDYTKLPKSKKVDIAISK